MKSDKENIDSRRLKISGQNFALLIKSLIEKNAAVKFKVTGKSMFPSIMGKDMVTLSSYKDHRPEIGDVIGLCDSQSRQIIIHRIIGKINEHFLIKGDNLIKNDGVFPRNQIIGYVSEIERNKKRISITRLKNRINVFLSKSRIFCLSYLFFLFKKR